MVFGSPFDRFPPAVLRRFGISRLPRIALRRPGTTLAVAAAVVLAAAGGLTRLELATDGRELLPRGDPAVRYDQALRRSLGLRDTVAVVVWSPRPEGIFEPRALAAVTELSERLAALDGVGRAHVTSLATEPGTRTVPGTLHPRPLLDPLPRTPREIDRLRQDLRRIPIYDGVLVSHDGHGAAVLVELPPAADRRRTVAEIRRRAAAAVAPPLTVDVVGAPVAEALLGDHLLADLGVPRRWLIAGAAPSGRPPLVPAALVFMSAVFFAAFRRPLAVLLPLLEVAVCLAVVFGVLGWAGIPLYLTTAILPVVLTAVGTADEIHVFRRLREIAAERPGQPWRQTVEETLEDMAGPVILTSVTTATAFLSFALSPIGPVRVFGLAAAAGVGVCLLFTLTVLPALLLLLPAPLLLPRTHPRGGSARGFEALARLAREHPLAAPAGFAAGLSVLALLGLPRLEVQDSWAAGFAADSPMARAITRFEEGFLGSHQLRLVIRGPRAAARGEAAAEAVGQHELTLPRAAWPADLDLLEQAALRVAGSSGREWRTWIVSAEPAGGRLRLHLALQGGSLRVALRPRPGERVRWEILSEPFRRPGPVAALAALEDFLARRPGVGGVLGPAAYLRTAHDLATGAGRHLPDRSDRLRAAWQNYAVLRGPARLEETVDPERWDRAVITVFQRHSSYRTSGRLFDDLGRWEARRLTPLGLTAETAGDVTVSRALIGAVVRTQLVSLALSLAGIGLVVTLLGGSWRWGAAALLPPALAVTAAFSALGAAGLPLGVATSMFAGIVLGVGVDGAVHLLTRLSRGRAAGLGHRRALAEALAGTGPPIALDALAVGGGFGLLSLSTVPANAHLGALLALAVATCLAANLLLLPALWVLGQRGVAPSKALPSRVTAG
jgi:predicted RND superfamily exporter protein